MTALRTMLAWDVRLQIRYGLYTVYAVLTTLFVLGVRFVDPGLRTDLAVLLIVTDPTVLGFYFIAAMVLFEKGEGVLDALVVTPLGDTGYLLSKVIALSALATLTATLVAVLGHGLSPRVAVLAGGVWLSASMFVLIGFVAVARFDSVNEYFLSAVGWGSVLFLPLFGYVGLVETPLFYALPTQPVLVLVEAGFRPVAPAKVLYAVGYLLVANALAFAWARRSFRTHVVRGGDPGGQLGRRETPRTERRTEQEGTRSRSRSPVIAMVLTDVRNWLRDPMLVLAATGPLVLAAVVRVGVPFVATIAGPGLDLTPYYPVVAGSIAVFGPAIYGFVVGMFVLEDREQGVYAAYLTSPLSGRGYLAYRGATAAVFGFAATLPALAVVGLVPVSPAVLVGTAVCSALAGPLVVLAFGLLASNTIEGIALSKFVNLVALGPALVVAFVPEPYQFVVGVVPTYWPVKTFVAGVSGDAAWIVYLFVGVAIHAVALAVLVRWFAGRTT